MFKLLQSLLMIALFFYFAEWWVICIVAIWLIACAAIINYLKAKQKAAAATQQNSETAESAATPLVTYSDTCPDDNVDYGEEGSVIWGPRTIEENICINGKWYINENSEEWEENEE